MRALLRWFPLRAFAGAETTAKGLSNISFDGWRSRPEILAAIKTASAVVVPSVCYEGFPMALVEAFACGTPAIGSNLGGVREIIKDGINGLHFATGDAVDLASKVEWAWSHPSALAMMGHAARHDFEEHYTAETNYKLLLGIYERAIADASRN